jgi:hypothetical protein
MQLDLDNFTTPQQVAYLRSAQTGPDPCMRDLYPQRSRDEHFQALLTRDDN